MGTRTDFVALKAALQLLGWKIPAFLFASSVAVFGVSPAQLILSFTGTNIMYSG